MRLVTVKAVMVIIDRSKVLWACAVKTSNEQVKGGVEHVRITSQSREIGKLSHILHTITTTGEDGGGVVE